MATRFYLPSSGTAEVTPPSPSGTYWGNGTAFDLLPLPTVKSDTPMADGTQRKGASNPVAGGYIDRAYVSAPLAAGQTIAGTFSGVLRGLEQNASLNAFWQVVIRAVSENGATHRAVLYDGYTGTQTTGTTAVNAELGTSYSTRIKNAIALTSYTTQDGDRIVVDTGTRKNYTVSSLYYTQYHYGDDAAVADLPLTGGSTTAGVPWIEFSQDLAFKYAQSVGPEPGRNLLLAT